MHCLCEENTENWQLADKKSKRDSGTENVLVNVTANRPRCCCLWRFTYLKNQVHPEGYPDISKSRHTTSPSISQQLQMPTHYSKQKYIKIQILRLKQQRLTPPSHMAIICRLTGFLVLRLRVCEREGEERLHWFAYFYLKMKTMCRSFLTKILMTALWNSSVLAFSLMNLSFSIDVCQWWNPPLLCPVVAVG